MATQISDTASGNSLGTDIGLVRRQAEQVADAANQIRGIANEVAEGSESQRRSLDAAVDLANEMTASMGETTTQLESIATSTEELVSSVNESAASIEQVGANSGSLAASITETSAAIEETARRRTIQ